MKKKQLFIVALAVTAILASAGMAFAAKDRISIATGGTSGTYFPIGGAIAQAVNKGGVLQATAETSNASVANINLIAKGDTEIAFVQNDIAYWAFKGEQMFKQPLGNVRGVAALYPEYVHAIIAKSANIKKIADLKDKRVGVGAPGSGTEGDTRAIIALAGLKYADMKVDFLDFSGVTSRFKDNQIDVGFCVAGYPTANVMDLALTKDISLLSFDDDFLAKLSKEHPYFVAGTIPGKTYKGVDNDTKTPAVMAILVTHDKMSDEAIYNFTKSLFDNIADIHASHASAKVITLATALNGMTVPLHPGAAKFFAEKGLKVPAK